MIQITRSCNFFLFLSRTLTSLPLRRTVYSRFSEAVPSVPFSVFYMGWIILSQDAKEPRPISLSGLDMDDLHSNSAHVSRVTLYKIEHMTSISFSLPPSLSGQRKRYRCRGRYKIFFRSGQRDFAFLFMFKQFCLTTNQKLSFHVAVFQAGNRKLEKKIIFDNGILV